MPDVKYTSGKGTEVERINNRLRNSGADAGNPGHTVVQSGNGPTRTFHNVHHTAGHHGGSAEAAT